MDIPGTKTSSIALLRERIALQPSAGVGAQALRALKRGLFGTRESAAFLMRHDLISSPDGSG